MSHFAAVLVRTGDHWRAAEVSLSDCESVQDIADVASELPGELRLVLVEEDDEYSAIVRVEVDEMPRVFLTDGHAADSYPLAEVLADGLTEIGGDELDGDEDAPPAHDSAPFGDPEVLVDLGTPAQVLLALCAQEGMLPIDVLAAVCEKAGCGEVFDELRG